MATSQSEQLDIATRAAAAVWLRMKVLLEPAPYTAEDWAIWTRHARRREGAELAYLQGWLLAHARKQDARDAQLILWREGFRQQCADLRAPQMRPRLWLLCMENPTSTPQTL